MARYAVIKDGVVANVVIWDGVAECDLTTADTRLLPDDSPVGPGYTVSSEDFMAPTVVATPPSQAEILAANTAQRMYLLSSANALMGPLLDAEALGTITASQIATLLLWRRYRIALGAIDLTLQDVAWPVAPDA